MWLIAVLLTAVAVKCHARCPACNDLLEQAIDGAILFAPRAGGSKAYVPCSQLQAAARQLAGSIRKSEAVLRSQQNARCGRLRPRAYPYTPPTTADGNMLHGWWEIMKPVLQLIAGVHVHAAQGERLQLAHVLDV